MGQFQEIKPEELNGNVFDLVGNQWMLITAGDTAKYNTMTASWGGMGVLWGKNVSFCFVRPQRYTYEFMERSGVYTLSFFGEEYRKALNFCGTKSGRDYDKAAETGLTPVFADGTVCFEQAKLVLVCKKLYARPFDPSFFTDAALDKAMYPDRDYHKAYIGEIVRVLKR